MTEAMAKAHTKLIKAALLINEAHRISIKEEGGSQRLNQLENDVLAAAAGLKLPPVFRGEPGEIVRVDSMGVPLAEVAPHGYGK